MEVTHCENCMTYLDTFLSKTAHSRHAWDCNHYHELSGGQFGHFELFNEGAVIRWVGYEGQFDLLEWSAQASFQVGYL